MLLRRVILAVSVITLLGGVWSGSPLAWAGAVHPGAQPSKIGFGRADNAFRVMLPLVVRGGRPGNNPTPTTRPDQPTVTTTATSDPGEPTRTPTMPPSTPTTTPEGPSGALVLGDRSYRSAGIAVDAQGGMHAVFLRTPPLEYTGEPRPAYYAYCSPTDLAACARRDNWSIVALDEDFVHAQIKVTPDGKPRLLLIKWVDDGSGGALPGHLYHYAECESRCTVATNWLQTTVLTSRSSGGLYETDYTYTNFALDPAGRPRFVYEDRGNASGAHRGSWYVFCNADCGTHSADNPSWYETRIDDPEAGVNLYINERTALEFTPDGYPRVLAGISTMDYVECNANCEDGANWSRATQIFNTGSGSSVFTWSLALDRQGRPRATFYPRGGPFYYWWCDAACSTPENWHGYTLNLGSNSGDYSSLVLDRQGRPRVAYHDAVQFGLGYAWCESKCESFDASWRLVLAEDDAAIGQDVPVPLLPECVRGGWFGGLRPSLSLDTHDNPRIAYDAEHKQECRSNPDDPNDPTTYVETKWWTARFLFFPHH